MSTTIYMTSGDDEREITSILRRNGARYDLSGAVVECHMKSGATVQVVTTVTVDPDQVDAKGQIVTEFAAADLVVGEWTLEWESTKGTKIITFPGKDSSRPVLIVREEAA